MSDFAYQLLSYYEQISSMPFFRASLVVIAILFFLFSVGLVRQHYFHLTMRGANFGFLAGIIFILILETAGGFLLIYGPKTLEIVTGKYNTTQVAELTREGMQKVGAILGQSSGKASERPTATSLIEQIPKLSKVEEDKLKNILCR